MVCEYEIMSAYTGHSYLLFETRVSKIISFGVNDHCEFHLSSGLSNSTIYSLIETMITGETSFSHIDYQFYF